MVIGKIKSNGHRHHVQIRELVAYLKRDDLQEIGTACGGASRPFLSAEAEGRVHQAPRVGHAPAAVAAVKAKRPVGPAHGVQAPGAERHQKNIAAWASAKKKGPPKRARSTTEGKS